MLVDCRREPGWPNPSARKLAPLLRQTAALVPNIYPGRFAKIILYPLPPLAARLARAAMRVLDARVREEFERRRRLRDARRGALPSKRP